MRCVGVYDVALVYRLLHVVLHVILHILHVVLHVVLYYRVFYRVIQEGRKAGAHKRGAKAEPGLAKLRGKTQSAAIGAWSLAKRV